MFDFYTNFLEQLAKNNIGQPPCILIWVLLLMLSFLLIIFTLYIRDKDYIYDSHKSSFKRVSITNYANYYYAMACRNWNF